MSYLYKQISIRSVDIRWSNIAMRIAGAAALLALAACQSYAPDRNAAPKIDVAVEQVNATVRPQIGDSVSIGLRDLPPGEQVDILLEDEIGREWSFARVFADERGVVDPFLFWYHSGVIGRPPSGVEIEFRPDPAFETFDEARDYFDNHALFLILRNAEGVEIARQPFDFTTASRPTVFPSDAEGVLMNSMNVFEDPMHVTATGLPAGARVSIAVTPNQHFWRTGDQVRDVTGKDGAPAVETVQLAPGATSLTIPVWEDARPRPGAYDIIMRINDGFDRDPRLRPDDIVSYGDDTAVVLFAIINGNIVIDISGRQRSAPAKYEFSDSFEKGDDVWGAVDPTDVPAVHSGGNYAGYYVVEDQPEAYWDGLSPLLADVSGGIEIRRVKYWCINASRAKIWDNATQADPIKGYDVVVDFGSTAAMTSGDYMADGVYDKGTDFIDGYQDVGFYVFEDPSSVGPFNVGTVEHLNETGISGMPYDPMGVTGPNYVVDLAWGVIHYPAQNALPNSPVSNAQATYPIAIFLHGRHDNCDSNGAAPGGAGSKEPPGVCAPANRIPDLRGYDYIAERLASQGIIAVSISAHEIQLDNGAWNYDLRGRLFLKWLDILRDWHLNGTDPWGGRFQGKIDFTKVGISGHSRGGEGAATADVLNDTWPNNYDLLAINAIAPTDQNNLGGLSYVPDDGAYYLIIPARDGDVYEHHGLRTYDRTYPEGAPDRKDKMMVTAYGANHNYFNTVWTDAAQLGMPNPWASAYDDSPAGPLQMTGAQQRAVGRTSIAAFFRRYLQDIEPYREIFTGRVRPSAMLNDQIYWTYQDKERAAVDNFEQRPVLVNQNTLNGMNSGVGFTTRAEELFNYWNSIYTPPPALPPQDGDFYGDTLGLKLAWAAPATYEALLPGGFDATPYTHLTMRVAKKDDGMPEAPLNLRVNVEDGSGNTALWDLRTDQFDIIPHPYDSPQWGAYQSIMSGVRIPLRNFTQNNSGVDLTDIRKIVIKTEGADEIGLDDIEFGN